jgi:GAF domain-containing protein
VIQENQLLKALKEENISLNQRLVGLHEETQRVWGLIRKLNQLQINRRELTRSSELLQMIQKILEFALEAVGSENGSVLLYDQADRELVFVAVIGLRSQELLDYRIPIDQGIAGWVARNRSAALVSDVRNDPRWLPAVDQSVGFHTQCVLAVPLIIEDRLLGVVEVVNSRKEDAFSEQDLQLLTLVARLASFVFGFTEEVLRENGTVREEMG